MTAASQGAVVPRVKLAATRKQSNLFGSMSGSTRWRWRDKAGLSQGHTKLLMKTLCLEIFSPPNLLWPSVFANKKVCFQSLLPKSPLTTTIIILILIVVVQLISLA